MTRERDVCIAGEPIEDVFGLVPEDLYWNSLLGDAESIWADMTSNPVYSILNLCRIAARQREKRIMSKLDGGQWALKRLDSQFHPLIQQAMTAYQSTELAQVAWNPAHLGVFGTYIREYIDAKDRR